MNIRYPIYEGVYRILTLGAEEVFRSLQEQKTEDEADRILRRIAR